jgi:hypothetical protein
VGGGGRTSRVPGAGLDEQQVLHLDTLHVIHQHIIAIVCAWPFALCSVCARVFMSSRWLDTV